MLNQIYLNCTSYISLFQRINIKYSIKKINTTIQQNLF